MEKVIIDRGELDAKASIEAGRLKLAVEHEGSLGGVNFAAFLKLSALVDLLEEKIPGDWDKIPAAMLKEAILKL